MARYVAPSGAAWEIRFDAGTGLVEGDPLGGLRAHACTDAEARLGTATDLIAAKTAAGYVLVEGEAPVVSRFVRRLEGPLEVVEITVDVRTVKHRQWKRERPTTFIVDDTRKLASAVAARELLARIEALYARRGLTRVRDDVLPDPPRPAPVAIVEDPALEAECMAAPDDPAPWAVLADRMIAGGDPRGEVAALMARGEEAAALGLAREHALFGTDAGALDYREPRWKFGFLRGASIHATEDERGMDLARDVRDFLALPIARFVDALRFGLADTGGNDWRPSLAAVVASRQGKTMRELAFDDYDSEDNEMSWTAYGDFTGAWEELPALEVLKIRAGGTGALGDLVLPRLKTFVRETGGLGADELASIVNARWPALEWLEVWFGQESFGAQGDVEAIGRILAGEGLPVLAHLGLVNCEFSDALVQALVRSAILARVTSLDLSRGVMATAAAETIVEHADAFRHLRRLDISENYLGEREIAELRGALAGVEIIDREQREPDPDAGYYAAVGE